MRIHPTKALILRAVATAKKILVAHHILWERLYTASALAELDDAMREEVVRGRPEVYGNAGTHLNGAHTAFRAWLDKFTDVYDVVSRWWVTPTAPIFESRATSALEGVLWGAIQLERHIDFLGPDALGKDIALCGEVVRRFCPRPERQQHAVQSALRRETAGILESLRQQSLIPIPGLFCPSQGIRAECSAEAHRHIPLAWHRLTERERWEALACPMQTDTCDDAESPTEERPSVVAVSDTNPGCLSFRVLGQVKHLPSPEAVKLIRGLLKVCPGALNLAGLEAVQPGGNKILAALIKDDPLWRAVIYMPGKRGAGGYRIRTEQEAQEELLKVQSAPRSKKTRLRPTRAKAA
jgi:hypothetical protein